MAKQQENIFEYNEDSIRSLDWKEHIRLRPGMYIGKLGDGSSQDDGIYVLLKEVMDNCIDEHMMGYGKQIDLSLSGKEVTIRGFPEECGTERSGNKGSQCIERLFQSNGLQRR
jgi:topoisomerase-4 subunit B